MKDVYVRVEVETLVFEDLDIITQSGSDPDSWEENELRELD